MLNIDASEREERAERREREEDRGQQQCAPAR
jgi:hypothetical protein